MNELKEIYGSLQNAATAESARCHEVGLFYTELTIDELQKMNTKLSEALKDMVVLYETDEGTRSLPEYKNAVKVLRELSEDW